MAVTHEDGQKATAYKPGSSAGVDLGEVTPSARFVKTGQPETSTETLELVIRESKAVSRL
ncbi:hypothetical protein ABET52_03430 [Saccharococcus caldoxylosilyticus]|uniref:hypothetical protein n=1 Tax=Saccharococcus caldoxylosilyticus TaxID=81408 RepID=UPI0005A7093A|nr:hypothetical protein [Parageobacillus caldoxylosilyticus]BDG35367.1 hypothetical protein PcaKH15_12730 [Parageobacillus caldoxylosilyticus]BDG39144.1 hypothetical protein PcaKH16_12830 [Parageobacillus caldoxylosilyticus]BDG42927.1 hypothetical protein PcaKH35_12720 [Parageobacillus caldoxylosilyticus]